MKSYKLKIDCIVWECKAAFFCAHSGWQVVVIIVPFCSRSLPLCCYPGELLGGAKVRSSPRESLHYECLHIHRNHRFSIPLVFTKRDWARARIELDGGVVYIALHIVRCSTGFVCELQILHSRAYTIWSCMHIQLSWR